MIPFAELAAGHCLDSLVKKKGTDAYDEWFKRKKWCLDYWLQLFHKCLRRVAAENFQVLPMEDANYRIHYVEAIHLNVFSFVKWLKLIFCSLEKESWRYQRKSNELKRPHKIIVIPVIPHRSNVIPSQKRRIAKLFSISKLQKGAN